MLGISKTQEALFGTFFTTTRRLCIRNIPETRSDALFRTCLYPGEDQGSRHMEIAISYMGMIRMSSIFPTPDLPE